MTWHNTSPGFPPDTRRRILERDPQCRCTGCPRCTPTGCTRPSTEADHLVRPAQGGNDHEDNGQGLCTWCHRWRTAQQAHANRPRQARTAEQHPGMI